MNKKLILTLIIITLNFASITNDGATVTIGEGVTLRSDGNFVNNGTLTNNGTLALSGVFSGSNTLSGTNVTYFGDAEVISGIDYNTLNIEGENTLSGSVEAHNLIISGDLNLSGFYVDVINSFVRDGGDISGDGYIRAQVGGPYLELENIADTGFLLSHSDQSVSGYTYRHSGMVDNNERFSLNTYFEYDLLPMSTL